MNQINIEDLKQDTLNFNKGTDEGKELLKRSLQEYGAGRSILIDKDDNIIAGNQATEAAIKAGIKKVRVIETTGDELVAVKRIDIDIDSKEGRELALLDNRTAQVNLAWDKKNFEKAGVDMSDFGIESLDIFPDIETPNKETRSQSFQAEDGETQDPNSFNYKYETQYGAIVMCESEEEQEKIYNQLTQRGFSCKVVSV